VSSALTRFSPTAARQRGATDPHPGPPPAPVTTSPHNHKPHPNSNHKTLTSKLTSHLKYSTRSQPAKHLLSSLPCFVEYWSRVEGGVSWAWLGG